LQVAVNAACVPGQTYWQGDCSSQSEQDAPSAGGTVGHQFESCTGQSVWFGCHEPPLHV
jgi:hypothetical protein